MRGFNGTGPEVTERALVSRERPHKKERIQQHSWEFVKHFPMFSRETIKIEKKKTLRFRTSNESLSFQLFSKVYVKSLPPQGVCFLSPSSLLKRVDVSRVCPETRVLCASCAHVHVEIQRRGCGSQLLLLSATSKNALWAFNWHPGILKLAEYPSPWLTAPPTSHSQRKEGGFGQIYTHNFPPLWEMM